MRRYVHKTHIDKNAQSNIILKIQKMEISTIEWLNTLWFIQTMEK